jgi:excisionase family DNA binding protein
MGVSGGPMMSIKAAAFRAGVSVFTMRAWLRQRRLAHMRLGRRIVIDPTDLETFLQTNRIEAVAPR